MDVQPLTIGAVSLASTADGHAHGIVMLTACPPEGPPLRRRLTPAVPPRSRTALPSLTPGPAGATGSSPWRSGDASVARTARRPDGRVRPGLLGVSTKLIGDPAVFDLDFGEGGDSTIRDVMLT